MKIEPVNAVLQKRGLSAPTLNALVADATNYSALLLQPQGVIGATNAGIRSRDRDLARAQFGKFLEEAAASQPDLIVTPEYSMPWEVLKGAIRSGSRGPAPGKLWVLGCESIRYSELKAMQQEVADVATILFEEMEPDDNRYVDPLAYVFRAPTLQNGGEARLVVLVQFKTHAMADPHDFEKNLLQPGENIYRFGTPGAGISLLTFICSDMLAFNDLHAQAVYDRALILHIQLNPKRQHTSLRGFRERILRLGGDATEILTLNWARGTSVEVDNQPVPGTKFAGSAWYLKADGIDLSDALVASNHRRGLYYTWMDSLQTHAIFFNFAPALFKLTASKVVRVGVPGPVAPRRGPALDNSKTWDVAQDMWTNGTPLADGFEDVLPESGHASGQLTAAYATCPCACERLLAICAGEACKSDGWHGPSVLDSFALSEAELIHRLTFCQPSNDEETSFRLRRLRKCGRLWDALQDTATLPAALADVAGGFTLEWTPDAKHQNLRPHAGTRGRATVMYLGDAGEIGARAAYNRARQRVHASLDEEAGHTAKRRVVAWYVDAQGARRRVHEPPRIDDQLGESPADIGRGA